MSEGPDPKVVNEATKVANPNIGASETPKSSKTDVRLPSAQSLIPRTTISADLAGNVKDVEKLDPVRKAGMQLAMGVGSLIAIVSIMVVVHWMATAPWTGVPSNFSSMKADDAKAVVENLKSISDLAADRSIKIFDAVVSRALLPVFTAILGYIFGSRTASSERG